MQGKAELLQQMETYAVRARAIVEHCDNEAQTKVSLVNPYLEMLGYDVRDPRHVRLEVQADFHEGREKVDYAILRDGEPWLVVEAKPATMPLKGVKPTKQIIRYAMASAVEYAALSNGRTWKWFRKNGSNGMLEDAAFLEHDACAPGERELRWLLNIHQTRWSSEEVARIADEEGLQSRFAEWFERAKDNPPEALLKVLLHEMGTKGTARMLERAKTAWCATIRAREADVLARASRRLQGDGGGDTREGEPEEPAQEESRRTRQTGRRKHYRFRRGGDTPWTYCNNGRHTTVELARAIAETGGPAAVQEMWTTDVKEAKDGEELGKKYDMVPGTNLALYGHLASAYQMKRMQQALNQLADLEIETENGEREEGTAKETWPWRPVKEENGNG